MSKRTEMAVTDQQCPWESGELGASVKHAKPVSREHTAAVDESLGLQMISIRLQKSLIDDLKYLADREGLGYQPLMRRVLVRYAAHEFKMIAMEQFSRKESQAKTASLEEDCDTPMAAVATC